MVASSEGYESRSSGSLVRIEPVHWDGQGRVSVIGEIDLSNVPRRRSGIELPGLSGKAAHAGPDRPVVSRFARRRDAVPTRGPSATRRRITHAREPATPCSAGDRHRASRRRRRDHQRRVGRPGRSRGNPRTPRGSGRLADRHGPPRGADPPRPLTVADFSLRALSDRRCGPAYFCQFRGGHRAVFAVPLGSGEPSGAAPRTA